MRHSRYNTFCADMQCSRIVWSVLSLAVTDASAPGGARAECRFAAFAGDLPTPTSDVLMWHRQYRCVRRYAVSAAASAVFTPSLSGQTLLLNCTVSCLSMPDFHLRVDDAPEAESLCVWCPSPV